jgi:hypothetical protein
MERSGMCVIRGHNLKAIQDGKIDQRLRSLSQYTCGRQDIGQRQGGVGFGELISHLTEAASDRSLVRLEVSSQSQVIRDEGVDPNLR